MTCQGVSRLVQFQPSRRTASPKKRSWTANVFCGWGRAASHWSCFRVGMGGVPSPGGANCLPHCAMASDGGGLQNCRGECEASGNRLSPDHAMVCEEAL